jgi:hypothetical protein
VHWQALLLATRPASVFFKGPIFSRHNRAPVVTRCRHIKDKFKYEAEDPRSSHAAFHGIAQWLNQ